MKSELGIRALTPWLQSYLQDTVKDMMAETNVDCDELSRRTGVDPRKIARALKSYKPSLGLLEALVRALGIRQGRVKARFRVYSSTVRAPDF
jgi:hypothetical protein